MHSLPGCRLALIGFCKVRGERQDKYKTVINTAATAQQQCVLQPRHISLYNHGEKENKIKKSHFGMTRD